MKKVIITGTSGFFGRSLAKKLLKNNIKVYGVNRDEKFISEFQDNLNYVPVVASFENYAELPNLIKDDIDIFFHFAWEGGFTTAIKDYRLQMKNASFVGDAVIAAKDIGCKKFIYSGTYNEFEIENFLQKDNFEPRYTCIYATGKTAGSLICRTLCYNLGMECNIALVPMPYGEYNYSKQLMNVVIDCLNKGISPKLVEGNNLYDIVYIEDIVDAFIAMANKGINQRKYYVGHRKLKTFKEWMIDIRNIINPSVELKFGEYKDFQNIDYSKIDLDLLYKDTGFECKSDFKSTILLTADWVKSLNL